MENDSKPKLLLSQENVQRLNEALTRIGADIRAALAAASKQAGEVVAKMTERDE